MLEVMVDSFAQAFGYCPWSQPGSHPLKHSISIRATMLSALTLPGLYITPG